MKELIFSSYNNVVLLHLKQMLCSLRLSYHSNTKACISFVCIFFVRLGHHLLVDCLATRWKIALYVFSKDTATRYRIGNRSIRLLARRSTNWATPPSANNVVLPIFHFLLYFTSFLYFGKNTDNWWWTPILRFWILSTNQSGCWGWSWRFPK